MRSILRREELDELQYITLIDNVASILSRGILSHALAKKVPHGSVAMQEVQDRRESKKVPGGGMLHEYANTYFSARNPMLYKLKNIHAQLCVLRINTAILDLEGVIVTDRNAASNARFSLATTGLAFVNRDLVFAEYWNHPGDDLASDNHKKVKCAEVLVPHGIHPRYLVGAYVSCIESQRKLKESISSQLPITVNPHLFFLGR
jgi:hypothetical protein